LPRLQILVAAGWVAHAELGPLAISHVVASPLPPAYVSDAMMAHRTTLVRAALHSQHKESAYNQADIRAATAIVMPSLPEAWEVADVQIFPSTFGPSVELEIRAQAFVQLHGYPSRTGLVADTHTFASAEPRGRPHFAFSPCRARPSQELFDRGCPLLVGMSRRTDDCGPPWPGPSAPIAARPPPRPTAGAARRIGPPGDGSPFAPAPTLFEATKRVVIQPTYLASSRRAPRV
jgi:hypothetical protein